MSGSPKDEGYAFFVAGHVYGNPYLKSASLGFHPPFLVHFNTLKDDPQLKFGILTGDITKGKQPLEEWDTIDSQLATLGKPVFAAPGNHDLYHESLYLERFQETPFSKRIDNDLYIFLKFTGDEPLESVMKQLSWLESQLADLTYNRLFIFLHSAIWVQHYPYHYARRFSNNHFGRKERWQYLRKILKQQPVETYIFSGDFGVELGIFYSQDGTIHLIGSGMGLASDENYLYVKVLPDHVAVDVVPLDLEKPRYSIDNVHSSSLEMHYKGYLKILKRSVYLTKRYIKNRIGSGTR